MSHSPTGWSGPDGAPQDAPGPGWDPAGTPQPSPGQAPPGPSRRPPVAAPTGPNWGLVLFGLVLLVVSGVVVAKQVTGVDGTTLEQRGPVLLVGIGVVCALVGVVGMARRRP